MCYLVLFDLYAVGFTKWEEQMQLESALDSMSENGTLFLDMSKKPLNNSWQQGKTDNILRSYQTFTKYPKGCFSRASFNKAEPLLQSLHRQSTCKKSLNVLHWANPRAVPAVYLILFVWWNKGTVTSWGGNRSLVMDLSRLKMVNIRVNLFGRCAAGMCEEVMVGHSQRTIISYLATLSHNLMDRSLLWLRRNVCNSTGMPLRISRPFVCRHSKYLTVSFSKNTKVYNLWVYIISAVIL